MPYVHQEFDMFALKVDLFTWVLLQTEPITWNWTRNFQTEPIDGRYSVEKEQGLKGKRIIPA